MSKLIVAFDYDDINPALAMAERLDPSTCAVKIGKEAFTRFGGTLVTRLVDAKFRVFLDLKFHDIPNTVAKACMAAADLGVWMVNVHTLGGFAMLESAKKALVDNYQNGPLLIGVTILTSMRPEDLQDIGINTPIEDQVNRLAQLASRAGLDGIVCAAPDIERIKNQLPNDFLYVTPGIRPQASAQDDQVRIMTPAKAVAAGSSYLVVGRPITQATDPMAVINKILLDIN